MEETFNTTNAESKKYSSAHKTTLKKNKKTPEEAGFSPVRGDPETGNHEFHSNPTKTGHNLDETTHTLSCARCQSLTGGMFYYHQTQTHPFDR